MENATKPLVDLIDVEDAFKRLSAICEFIPHNHEALKKHIKKIELNGHYWDHLFGHHVKDFKVLLDPEHSTFELENNDLLVITVIGSKYVTKRMRLKLSTFCTIEKKMHKIKSKAKQ